MTGPQHDTDARSAILGRVRAALADHPDTPEVPRDYRRTTPAGTDLLGRFAERVEDYRATVRRVTAAELPAAIADALGNAGVRRLAVPADLPGSWLSAAPAVDPVVDEPALGVHELDGVDGVLTGCAVGIADTGTIVLDAGARQGRRVLTLLPDYHLCVISSEQIVGGIPEALLRLEPGRPLTWISGPSATSDIELDRVEGVHGPRTLEVLLTHPIPRE